MSETHPSGAEIRIYEESRRPRHWHELLAPWQCAVLFKRLHSEQPLSPGGTAVAFHDATFFIFNKLDEARSFSERKALEHPQMCCEIFDSKGKGRPPLLTIVHPTAAEKDEISASSVRKRAMAAVALFLGAAPLIWWDRRAKGALVLPTLLGINMIFAGLRLLQWNTARQERMDEEKKRVTAHLAVEKEFGERAESVS